MSNLKEIESKFVLSIIIYIIVSTTILYLSVDITKDMYYKKGNIDGMKGWYYYELDSTKINNYENFKIK